MDQSWFGLALGIFAIEFLNHDGRLLLIYIS